MLAMAHVHGADGLKARAAAFVREHSAEVMQTAGWSELVKQPALVNYVVSAVATTTAATTPATAAGERARDYDHQTQRGPPAAEGPGPSDTYELPTYRREQKYGGGYARQRK
jgi:hypothetical protein